MRTVDGFHDRLRDGYASMTDDQLVREICGLKMCRNRKNIPPDRQESYKFSYDLAIAEAKKRNLNVFVRSKLTPEEFHAKMMSYLSTTVRERVKQISFVEQIDRQSNGIYSIVFADGWYYRTNSHSGEKLSVVVVGTIRAMRSIIDLARHD